MLWRSLAVLVIVGVSLRSGWGQTAYPMLMSIEPVAVQIGTTSTHTIKSRYSLQGAYQLIVSGNGVQGAVIPAEPPAKEDKGAKPASTESLKVSFQVSADALPGVRDVRVATPRGVSTVAQLVVVADPVVYEQTDNNKRESAQRIDLPATVCGRIEKAEDIDVFQFHADAEQTWCFHTLCMRLQDRVHDLQQHADPILVIRDSHGSIVASSDNEFSADPTIYHRFARADDYTLEIRDVRYQGNQYWEYCIEINTRPLITTVYPLGVSATQPTKLEPIGIGTSGMPVIDLVPQPEQPLGCQRVTLKFANAPAREVPLLLTAGALHQETAEENNGVSSAQAVSVPGVINGRLSGEGDVDCFRFAAKKDQRFDFEVWARRLGAATDSHLRILDAKGNQLQLSDDMRSGKRNYADSLIENWTAPADGEFFIEIRDLHLRGGEPFVYAIQVTASEPYFNLFADTDKTPISPGTTGVVYVRAERKNGFTGEIELSVQGLPSGVTAHAGRILGGKAQDGCIVFEVAENAAPSVVPITISGRGRSAEGNSQASTAETKAPGVTDAVVYQEIYQPGGGRGHWPVESHVVAVTAPGDIRRVTLSETDLKLKPGESKSVDVVIERAEGFDKNVLLEATYSHLNTIFGSSLPEGITIDAAKSTTLLTGGATKGRLTFKAADNAPAVSKQQAVIMANVSLNFVMKATYASQPMLITIDQ